MILQGKKTPPIRMIGIILSFLLLSTSAFANIGLEAGMFAGPAIVNGQTTLTYGINAGLVFDDDLYIGGLWHGIGLGVPAGFLEGHAAATSLTSIILEGHYRFRSFSEGLYAGVRTGFVFSSSYLQGPLINIDTSGADFSAGPVIGYFFDIGSGFKLAPEGAFMLLFGSSVSWVQLAARISYSF